MPDSSERINVFTPRTLADLLSLKRKRPDVTIFAGGTYLLYNSNAKYPALPASVASIRHLEELKRIHRTERHIELGSCVTLCEISRIGGRAIPPVLAQAIAAIASPPVRSLATLGGNICAPEQRLTLFPVLFILDARLELREHGGSRWVPITRMAESDGKLNISDSEVLTRVRVPLSEWNTQCHRSLAPGPGTSDLSLSFCGLANTNRGVLTDFRFIFGSMGKVLLRNREIEAGLVSRKVPLPDRDSDALCEVFDNYVETSFKDEISSYQAGLASKTLRWFLASLGDSR
jgi:CO/xanthine dehydrogenase FAD-binding subunit